MKRRARKRSNNSSDARPRPLGTSASREARTLLLPGSGSRPPPRHNTQPLALLSCCMCLFQVFQMFYRYVASVSYFHTGVSKVDRNVAHVAIVVCICCKFLFSLFHLFFPTYVASVFI
jgi:hypothetical protein